MPHGPYAGIVPPGAPSQGWVASPHIAASRPWGDTGGEGRLTPLSPPPQVALQCLWSIKMVVLVKPEHERRISHVHTSSVKTGIANTLGRAEDGVGACPRVRGHPRDPPRSSVLSTSLQGTRELWASPSFSMGPPSASSTATWPRAVRRLTGDGGAGGDGAAWAQVCVPGGMEEPWGGVGLSLSSPGQRSMRMRCPWGGSHGAAVSHPQA